MNSVTTKEACGFTRYLQYTALVKDSPSNPTAMISELSITGLKALQLLAVSGICDYHGKDSSF
jgi:hypothetical protein